VTEAFPVSVAAPNTMDFVRRRLAELDVERVECADILRPGALEAEVASALLAFRLWAALAFGGGLVGLTPSVEIVNLGRGASPVPGRVTAYLAALAFTYPAMTN
jgi:hypothetical protein